MGRDNVLLPVQCQMARAGLNLGIRDLAALARVSPTTITRFERGETLLLTTLDAIRTTLEALGARFPSVAAPTVSIEPRRKPASPTPNRRQAHE